MYVCTCLPHIPLFILTSQGTTHSAWIELFQLPAGETEAWGDEEANLLTEPGREAKHDPC